MTNGRKIVKGIAAAGAVLGGIDLFQDCGAVYAAELEEAETGNGNRILAELELEASASTSENVICSEAVNGGASGLQGNIKSERADGAWSRSEDMTKESWLESETMTTEKWSGFESPVERTGNTAVHHVAGHHTAEEQAAYSVEAYRTAEWRPTHGYRGAGSWELTRKAVENACVNEGLELSGRELDEGADLWFFSGVTLLYFNTQYGSGWDAFLNWFEQVSGERKPNFGEEELGEIRFFLSETATSESVTSLEAERSGMSRAEIAGSSTAADKPDAVGAEAAEETMTTEEKPPLSVEAE